MLDTYHKIMFMLIFPRMIKNVSVGYV